jgi:hypothetical protein
MALEPINRLQGVCQDNGMTKTVTRYWLLVTGVEKAGAASGENCKMQNGK